MDEMRPRKNLLTSNSLETNNERNEGQVKIGCKKVEIHKRWMKWSSGKRDFGKVETRKRQWMNWRQKHIWSEQDYANKYNGWNEGQEKQNYMKFHLVIYHEIWWKKCTKAARFQGIFFLELPNLDNSLLHPAGWQNVAEFLNCFGFPLWPVAKILPLTHWRHCARRKTKSQFWGFSLLANNSPPHVSRELCRNNMLLLNLCNKQ